MAVHRRTDVSRRPQSWNAVRSARDAYSGLLWVVSRTPSLKIGIVAGVVVVGLGLTLQLAPIQVAVLVLTASSLLAVETLNTGVEMLCDHVTPRPDPVVGKIKDVAAAATAFCEIGGLIVVLLVLGPAIFRWLTHQP